MMFQMKNGWIVTALNLVKNIKFSELVNVRTCTRTVTVIFGSHGINSFPTHSHTFKTIIYIPSVRLNMSFHFKHECIHKLLILCESRICAYLRDLQNDHFNWIYFFSLKPSIHAYHWKKLKWNSVGDNQLASICVFKNDSRLFFWKKIKFL